MWPARQARPFPRAPAALGYLGPPLLAVAGCAVCFFGGWRGTDWAAQVYRAGQAARWGLIAWDPGWYGGTYPLNYSLAYPLAAGYLGLWLVAAASAAGAAYCFDRLIVRELGRRPPGSWYFAASTVVLVAIGQLPTLAAEALALGSVLCLADYRQARGSARSGQATPEASGHWASRLQLVAGLLLGTLAALTSPVVGSFLALALVAWGVADIGHVQTRTAAVELMAGALVFAGTATLPLVFPGAGYFPFGPGDLVVVLAICALIAGPFLHASRPVRAGALLYGAVSIGLFAFHTQMGDNDARWAAYIGVPLVLCYLPRLTGHRAGGKARPGRHALPTEDAGRRLRLGPAAGALAATLTAAFLVVWHWSPIVEAFGGAGNGPSSTAAYYTPLVDELGRLSRGSPVRVEIPPTLHHWESAYVAPSFPLARGWERQLDVAYDGLFYQPGPLHPSAYRAWLLSNGVSFVALPRAPLDYGATAEAMLLRSGEVAGLRLVWQNANWRLWRVLGSPGLSNGPGKLTTLTPRSVVVRFQAPGTTALKLRWSPYWSVPPPARAQSCLKRAPGGWTQVSSSRPAALRLSLSLLHADHGSCPATGSVRS